MTTDKTVSVNRQLSHAKPLASRVHPSVPTPASAVWAFEPPRNVKRFSRNAVERRVMHVRSCRSPDRPRYPTRVASSRPVGREDSYYDWEVFVREQICMPLRPRCGTGAKDLERGPEEVLDRWLV
jgi:hypothetical protein